DASKKVIKLLTQKLEPQDLYIIENSIRFNSREISTSTIIKKMKHDIFKNGNYNIVNVDADFYFKNLRLKYKGRAERKGNPSVITMINQLQQENKRVPSGCVNTIVKYLPGSRAVGERMMLSDEYDPEKNKIDTIYYIKKFNLFIRSYLNIEEKEAWGLDTNNKESDSTDESSRETNKQYKRTKIKYDSIETTSNHRITDFFIQR
ncbi:16274_t:CDS:2, partial [Racocetra persica]